jgi:ligand-binding SRPBCC domain-containing protein
MDLASDIVTTLSEIHLATTVEAAFAYLSDAANLTTAMPAWLRLEVRTPLPIAMDVGTVIEYRLRIYGVPVPWRSEFTVWEPPHRFAYEQRRGPFRRWMHEHVFQPDDEGGVCIRDDVDYAVPGGRIIDRLIVSGLLERLFRHRAAILTRAISSA